MSAIPNSMHPARTIAVAIVGALIALSSGAANAADTPPPMITPGQFSVSSTGAFTYSVPIVVPPGSAEMVPALSLDYSSQNGDGLEGFGWVLSGLPAITRCPRTIAQDNFHGSVNFDANDRFCLENQRLVLISGTYGADGSQYRTETDGFSEIIAHGQSGSGPAWFEIHTKSGQIMQLGNTADSKAPLVPVPGSTTGPAGTVRAWAVNQIADTKGNYINIQYDNGTPDTTNGQVYPTSINYTGNTAASQTPYNSIFLYYSTRTDIVPIYQTGSLQQTTLLLSDIKTYAGLNVVTDYKLAYQLARPGATHDDLTSITVCDGGTPTPKCLAPTTFTWAGNQDAPPFSVQTPPQWISQSGAVTLDTIFAGDFNGDGLTDALLVPLGTSQSSAPQCSASSQSNIFYGQSRLNPAGTFLATPFTANYSYWLNSSGYTEHSWSGYACFNKSDVPSNDAQFPVILDFNGDGIADLLFTQVTNGSQSTQPLLNQPVSGQSYGNLQSTQEQTGVSGIGAYGVGDFNGDGLTDFLGAKFGGGFTPYISNGDGTFTPLSETLPGTPVVADFNGDGCADEAALGPSTFQITYSCSSPIPTLSLPNWSGSTVLLGDFNGDGKTDFLVVNSSGATLYLSTGTGLAPGIAIPNSSTWHNFTIVVGDWSGDGKSDLALINPSGNAGPVYFSTGTGFIEVGQYLFGTYSGMSAVVADWNNDGASDLLLQNTTGTTAFSQLFMTENEPEVITSVTNGVGISTQISYSPLNQNNSTGAFYTKCPNNPSSYACGDTFPTVGIDGPLYVVSRIDSGNALGNCQPPQTNCYSSTYTYAGAKADQHGRGFLGFQSMAVTDLQTGLVQTTNYAIAFPETGLIASQTKIVGSVIVSSMTNTYTDINLGSSLEGVARHFVELSKTVTASNDLNGAAMPTVTTTYSYDCDTGGACGGSAPTGFGNVMQVATSVSDGSSKTTTNTYSNDSAHWYLGRLLTSNVQSIVGTSNITRHTSYTYDPASGLLTSTIVESGASDLTLTQETDYGYDTFGNKTSATVKACVWSGGNCTTTSRQASDTYDSLGEFVTKSCNALNQCETWAHDARYGTLTSHTSPNNITTSWSYDTFGRQTNETRADSTQAQVTYAYCSGINGGTASCPTNGAFLRQTTPTASDGVTQIGSTTITYYDALSRSIGSDTQGFDGSTIRVSVQYDANGHVHQTSRPYFVSGGTAQYTVNTYDALGRVTLSVLPNTGQITNAYNGLTVTVTNPNNQSTITTKNAQGLVASVTDANSKTTNYVYDAEDNLLTVTDPNSNVTANVYDLRGRKTASTDPDMGHWTYVYDGYGELASQTDAKNQTVTMTYDALGRLTQRVEPDLTSSWIYDSAAHGIGKLSEATTSTGYSRTLNYDTLSRPTQTTLIIGGNSYAYQTAYDSDGRVSMVTYPSGFIARNVYTSLSYLSQIVDNGTSTAIWTANTRDAELHLTQATAGNGVVTNQAFTPQTGLIQSIQSGTSNAVANFAYGFDLIGNLTSRSDENQSLSEQYCYDSLNRLTNSATGTNGASVANCTSSGTNIIDKAVGYDALGDIASKSDVGTYTYGAGAGPHAVTSIAGTVNGVTNPIYTYDPNGNMSGGAGRTIASTSFNMAASVTQGATNIAFAYDSEHARITQVSGTTTTTYVNDPSSGGMEETVSTGGPATYRDYIKVDGNLVALRTAAPVGTPTNWGAGNWGGFTWSGYAGGTYLYFVTDHLGSVAVITNQAGQIVERDSYDAWGRRRNASGTDSTSCAITTETTRGFTGQEMMDSVCIVNLNARLYDPTIGRFLTADPVVGSPFIPQELNRFSYVLNNPLSFTDPSGLCFLGCFWQSPIFRGVVAIAVAIVLQQYEVLPSILAESYAFEYSAIGIVVNGGIVGGISGAIATGTLRGAGLGMLQGALFAESGNLLGSARTGLTLLGSHELAAVVAHGFVGGLVSIASGSKFYSGFLAGGISSLGPTPFGPQTLAQTTLDTVEHSVLGGLGSVLGGGKFENGAATGAFEYLFNYLAHASKYTQSLEQKFIAQGGGDPQLQDTEQEARSEVEGFHVTSDLGLVLGQAELKGLELAEWVAAKFDLALQVGELANSVDEQTKSTYDWEVERRYDILLQTLVNSTQPPDPVPFPGRTMCFETKVGQVCNTW